MIRFTTITISPEGDRFPALRRTRPRRWRRGGGQLRQRVQRGLRHHMKEYMNYQMLQYHLNLMFTL